MGLIPDALTSSTGLYTRFWKKLILWKLLVYGHIMSLGNISEFVQLKFPRMTVLGNLFSCTSFENMLSFNGNFHIGLTWSHFRLLSSQDSIQPFANVVGKHLHSLIKIPACKFLPAQKKSLGGATPRDFFCFRYANEALFRSSLLYHIQLKMQDAIPHYTRFIISEPNPRNFLYPLIRI